MRKGPRAPGWVVWLMRRLTSEDDVRVTLAELDELHEHWEAVHGRAEADRRHRRELREYPFRLLGQALASLLRGGPWNSPRSVLSSARSLARAPGLTSAVVLTVGIGIGGCTVVFAVVDALFLRPLPYPEPQSLTWIYTDSPPNRWPFSVADLQALQDQQTSFTAVGAYSRNARTLVGQDGAEIIGTLEATDGLFDLLGVRQLSGRFATPEDGDPEAAPTVMVTRGFASRHLGSVRPDGSDALGAAVRLDGEDHTVIGVLPADFGPLGADVEVFPTLRLRTPERKGPFFLRVVGRLAPGVEPDRATEELRAINARLFPVWADSYQDEGASWGQQPLTETLQGDSARLLTVLMGAVAMLLLVAVANAANLLLARVTARRRELAVRRALGASTAQVAGTLLTESMLLATGGVAVGLLLARLGIGSLPLLAGGYLPRLSEVSFGGPTVVFAAAVAGLCGLLFGIVPTLRGSRASEPSTALRSGRGTGATRSEQRLQRLLVSGQIAVVMPLLIGAGLLLTSFVKLQGTDPGFDPDRLVSMRVTPSPAAFPDAEARGQLWAGLLDRIAAMPEVTGVGLANARPPRDVATINNFDLEDSPTPPGTSQPSVPWVMAEPGYFRAMGIPLLAGRMFDDLDRNYEPEVAIVDAAWAHRFFPGEEAVGRRFRHGGCTECAWTTVVGVVGTVPYQGLGEDDAGVVYQPDPARFSFAPFLVVRTGGEATQAVSRIRAEIQEADASTPITAVQTGESLLAGSLTQPRHLTLLLAAFALVALALAIVGLYGVTAHSVERRRGDIAVRMALGGSPGGVLAMVVRQGITLALVGLALGGVASLGLTRVLTSLLYGVSPRDPLLFLGVAALLLAVSAAACLVPARRTMRLDPATTLREE